MLSIYNPSNQLSSYTALCLKSRTPSLYKRSPKEIQVHIKLVEALVYLLPKALVEVVSAFMDGFLRLAVVCCGFCAVRGNIAPDKPT